MNILQSLEAYTSAQKWVGINFIILGSILVILAGIFTFFVLKTPMSTGMKWGALVSGILILVGGMSYYSFCNKTQLSSQAIYKRDVTEFLQFEYERMEKVDKDFLLYQLTFTAFIVAALIIILFINMPLLKGVSYAVAILFLGILIIEGFSHTSITKYTSELKKEVQC
ncbi:hypothetical protein MY04_4434 [Flammeovirga sp. MY04]|uniref:hypothetical protein n=1 Tax=Flammeovirga sp. MY04 TaxID=1191459 RepID=UPI0008061F89|nr:hypothetical protein [Flammeovirga sp. MY04]ANQ51770.1 hypothetical protein MY04_4434 [Flammeovirga sp. MY04]